MSSSWNSPHVLNEDDLRIMRTGRGPVSSRPQNVLIEDLRPDLSRPQHPHPPIGVRMRTVPRMGTEDILKRDTLGRLSWGEAPVRARTRARAKRNPPWLAGMQRARGGTAPPASENADPLIFDERCILAETAETRRALVGCPRVVPLYASRTQQGR